METLVIPVAIAIMLVWIAAAVFAFVTQQYVPLEIATPVVLIVAGRVFGVQLVKNGRPR